MDSNISLTGFFIGLLLVVLMGDFYQFAPVVSKTLWDISHKDDEIYGKAL